MYKRLLLPLMVLGCCTVARAGDYPREHVYDTRVGRDEQAVNVSLVSNRWPDTATLETTVESIFRLEGVADRKAASDQDRALALWKWFRIMVSATGGGYVYEGPPGRGELVHDPHKIFAVYGHHMCDGQSWAMVPLWRAAGYMAFDQCTLGHTIASLRYRDADGMLRYHDFDPQGRFYYWDENHKRVGVWTMPVMTGRVYRHVLTPQNVHSGRTSLRLGETVLRSWTNTGHVVPNVTRGREPDKGYYGYELGKTRGVYAIAGQQVQTLDVRTGAGFDRQLADGSSNAASTDGLLHPADAAKPAELIWRLAPPYVVVDGRIAATLTKADPADLCRLSISRDGGPWQVVFDKKFPGDEAVTIDVGQPARQQNRPDAYTAYDVRVRCELKSATGRAAGVGVKALRVELIRMLSKRSLPNLMPGENVFRLSADRLAPGQAIELKLAYERDGQPVEQLHTVRQLPYYFAIDEPFELRNIRNYDQDFNNEAVRMVSYSLRLVMIGQTTAAPNAVAAPDAEPKFAKAYPHPADMNDRKQRTGDQVERDPMQTSGFLPQSKARRDDPAAMAELVKTLHGQDIMARWKAAQSLGDYPAAADVLIAALPEADIDLTLFVTKALAQIGDPRAIDPLLDKWNRGMRTVMKSPQGGSAGGAPGTRYIPDALAAIVQAMPADQRAAARERIVPALVAPLTKVRFDFRFHIAHALGELGGSQAEAALRDLAERDPFAPVREQAAESLKRLNAAGRPQPSR